MRKGCFNFKARFLSSMKKETILGFKNKLACSSSFRSGGLYRTQAHGPASPQPPEKDAHCTQRAFPRRSGRSRPQVDSTGTGGDTGGGTRAAGLTQRSAGWTRGPGSAGQPSLAPRRPTGMGCSGSPPRPRAQLAVVQTPWAVLPRLLLAQRERCSAPAKQRAWGLLLKARARGRTALQPARPPSA